MLDRRLLFLCALLALPLLVTSLAAPARQEPAALEAILLGTGFPRPDPNRAGPSTAIVHGEKLFLVDAGRGVTMRLAAAGIPLRSLRAVFLTHLHSDHTGGLPDLFATSWIFGRHAPLALYGPPGTAELGDAMVRYFAADVAIRRQTEGHPPEGMTVAPQILREGVVYESDGLRITAFAVDHRPVEPAYGLRFDAGGKRIVISGDTAPSDNLVKHARGADVLIHEVYLPEHFDRVDSPDVAARLKRYHTSAEEVGEIARRAEVKLLVLTHVIPSDGEAEIVRRAGKHYRGPIVVGRDLMRF
jgi:ribonuclease Z